MMTRIPLDDATVLSRSQPAQTQTIDTPIDPTDRTAGWKPRSERLAPRRSRLPGFMVAALLVAAITAVAVSSLYDERSLGTRIDDSVATARDSLQTGVQNATGAVGTARSAARPPTPCGLPIAWPKRWTTRRSAPKCARHWPPTRR